MPLAGGRGPQEDLNGEMDSLSLRISADYRTKRTEIPYVGVFDVDFTTVVRTGNITGIGDLTAPVILQKLQTFEKPIVVDRVSTYIFSYGKAAGDNVKLNLSVCLYRLDTDTKNFSKVANSQVLFTDTTPNPVTGWRHVNLPGDQKFRLEPKIIYFCGFYTNLTQALNGMEIYSIGKNTVQTTLYSTTLSSLPDVIPRSSLTTSSSVTGFPNVIYSNSTAAGVFLWP